MKSETWATGPDRLKSLQPGKKTIRAGNRTVRLEKMTTSQGITKGGQNGARKIKFGYLQQSSDDQGFEKGEWSFHNSTITGLQIKTIFFSLWTAVGKSCLLTLPTGFDLRHFL